MGKGPYTWSSNQIINKDKQKWPRANKMWEKLAQMTSW